MYLVSPASKEVKSKSNLKKKRGKQTPLVRKRQTTAVGLQLPSKNAEVANILAASGSKVKGSRHRNVAGSKGRRFIPPHSTWHKLREKLKNADILTKGGFTDDR
jgi:hypothetical protein